MARNIVWQYSPEWQCRMGIFHGQPGGAGCAFENDRASDQKAAAQDGAIAAKGTEEEPDGHDVTSDREAAQGEFVPARDKLEAVNRISALVDGPAEKLGPGSKEGKSFLLSVASALDVDEGTERRTKPELAGALVEQLGGRWTDHCWSTGSTITLVGLNTLLKALEGRRARAPRKRSPEAEGRLLSQVVAELVPSSFEGRIAVTEMLNAESTDWAKSEWIGFYFEFLTLGPCFARLGGAPFPTQTRTVFDFGGAHVWDFKAHSGRSPWAILNDKAGTDWVLETRGGLGLVVLSGDPEFDDSFRPWFDELKRANGKVPKARNRPAKYSRPLKSAFVPTRLDIAYLTRQDWKAAVADDVLRVWDQPPQPGGQPRKPKYMINVAAMSRFVVDSRDPRS